MKNDALSGRRGSGSSPFTPCLRVRGAQHTSLLIALMVLHHQFSSSTTGSHALLPGTTRSSTSTLRQPLQIVKLSGWLEDFFEPQKAASATKTSRQVQYPEQYPASYELNTDIVEGDESLTEAKLVRPLLKNTQLQSRPLQLVYSCSAVDNDASWNPSAFHSAVDGKGAAVILATAARDGRIVGGYNPKGWASLGGARPSVAAFLFYERDTPNAPGNGNRFQKLQKVGGGGLACARDDPGFGISLGADGLVIGLQPSRERVAQSKLGPYFERGPEGRPSLFDIGGTAELSELKVLVGCYDDGDEIPYSGGVLDMTSG